MEPRKVIDNDIHEEDSTIYLFGSELYCGWCLESFTCPVRLKIHCHVEHLVTCSCGEEFDDKQSLRSHVASAGCLLPPPFHWSHFVNLPSAKLSEVNITEAPENGKQCKSPDKIFEMTDRKTPDKPGENTEKTASVTNRKTFLKKGKQKGNKESSLKSLERIKYCCGHCSFQSSHKHACNRHIQQYHRKKIEKFMPYNNASKDREDYIDVGGKTVTGRLSEAIVVDKASAEKTLSGISGCMNACLASCEQHRGDDIQFVVSCFSSPVGDKPLYCDLCGDKFGKWEGAALHVYNSHFSDLDQWRDSHRCVTDIKPLNEKSSDEKSADSAVGDQLEKLSSAMECDVPKSDNGMDNRHVHVNVSERASADDLERDVSDTSVDQSKTHLPENKEKRKFTTDECKVLASSLCRLLNCCNGESEPQIPDCKTFGTHSAKVEGTVTVPSPSQKLPTASYSDRTKMAASEMAADMQLLSRKCKFCQRVCSSKSNCQRHETVCRRMHPFSKSAKCKFCHRVFSNEGNCRRHEAVCSGMGSFSKSGTAGLRQISGSNICYCARCGFSDTDRHVVNAHLMEPHVVINGKLRMEVEPGHDYIGSMRIAPGYFQCSICSCRLEARSRLLTHLRSHSSPVVLTLGTMHTTNPESSSDKVESNKEEQTSGLASGQCARSCPKCSRSFVSIAKYLHHRGICRATEHCKVTRHRTDRIEFHYLFDFCEQAADGRWKCRLCNNCTQAHRGDLYKHIRSKHGKVENPKLETCKELSEQGADGLWHCKLCDCNLTLRRNVYRHILRKHAAAVTEKLKTPKPNDVGDVCVETSHGIRWQCRLCKHSCNRRSDLSRHIRAAHGKAAVENTAEGSAVASCGTAPRVREHTDENTALRSKQQKSRKQHLIKRCPNCSRIFMNGAGYCSHVKWCHSLGRFMETMSSGRARCRLCHLTYETSTNCRVHLRRKHLSSDEPQNASRGLAGTNVDVKNPMPADYSISASNANEECSYDGIFDKSIKTEN